MGNIGSQIQSKRGFSHTRSGAHQNQIPLAQSHKHRIQFSVTGGTAQLSLILGAGIDFGIGFEQHIPDVNKIARHILIRKGGNLGFGRT